MSETDPDGWLCKSINESLDEIIDQCDAATDRDTLIEVLDQACDEFFGDYVRCGQINEYTLDDMVETCDSCAEIIRYAHEVAWVETDSGLWEGMVYGVLAAVAFGSLRNCFYQLMVDRGYDSNNELPFESKSVLTKIPSCPECRCVLSDYHSPYCPLRSSAQPFVTEYHCEITKS